jgi:hypothetical protein
VGFGDCFLLSFYYTSPAEQASPADQRHVLIDFGTRKLPESAAKGHFLKIAQNIKEECERGEGKLHALVVTHRHSDHLSAFGDSKVYPILKGLSPGVVIQPWTEDPKLPTDATGPLKSLTASQTYVRYLSDQGLLAQGLLKEGRWLADADAATCRQLAFLGEENLKNLNAVKNLQKIAPPEKHRYVYYGSESGLEEVLEGVKTMVLGPPTLEQYPTLKKDKTKCEAEYWRLCLSTPGRGQAGRHQLFSAAAARSKPPAYARWFVDRAKMVRSNQLLELVRNLDEALNNTSVILLFEIGDKCLLFPGDAEVGNWSYALFEAVDKDARREQLAGVTLYKVGHHGSMNATPKTLWATFENKGKKKQFTTLMSTMAGVYTGPGEIPRGKLVAELQAKSTYITTEKTPSGEFFQDVIIQA